VELETALIQINMDKNRIVEIFTDHCVWSEEHGHDIIIDIQFQRVAKNIAAELNKPTDDPRSDEMLLNMQYYMEYCNSKGYVTPQDWLEKYKHF